VEVFELFEVDDLFGDEVGVVQITNEVDQVFLGLNIKVVSFSLPVFCQFC
jgi:hypothetical protein